MPRSPGLLLTVVALSAVVGCGGSDPSTGSTSTALRTATTSTVAPAAIPQTQTSDTAATAKTKTSSTPARNDGGGLAAATATGATTTTPRNLPAPRKRSGPRNIGVAESATPIDPSGGRTAAQQLVEAWKGHAVSRADSDVELVQRHLRSLEGKCTEPEATIAGYIRLGIEKYRTTRVVESPVELSRALDSATPPGRSNCKGILRTLLAQVEQG